jgi:phospholipid/cholesterol/gamma-HCH transport system ATP-binding protein
MIGLKEPAEGDVLYDGKSFWKCGEAEQQAMLRKFGILFQGGALWTSMTLSENVALPLGEHTLLSGSQITEMAHFKLSLVGLAGFEDFYPSEISGGMRKRAGLARAMSLDPQFLFLDEPSAGLDPISSRRQDDLILELRDSLGATIIVVSHELASIFAIGDRAIFGSNQKRFAPRKPKELLDNSDDRTARVPDTRTTCMSKKANPTLIGFYRSGAVPGDRGNSHIQFLAVLYTHDRVHPLF